MSKELLPRGQPSAGRALRNPLLLPEWMGTATPGPSMWSPGREWDVGSGLVVTSELCPRHWGLQKTQGETPRMQAGTQLLATMVPVAVATPASWDNLSENSSSGDIRLAQPTPFHDLGSVHQAPPQHCPLGGWMSDSYLVPHHHGKATPAWVLLRRYEVQRTGLWGQPGLRQCPQSPRAWATSVL